jgi:hypothetical protein
MMIHIRQSSHLQSTSLFVLLWLCTIVLAGCGGSYDETISGIAVPVPKAMARSADKPSEMSILGFGAGRASFQGDMAVDKIVEFYKRELPARGWQPSMNVQSGGAMLTYAKEGKTLLITIGEAGGKANLMLTVAGMAK